MIFNRLSINDFAILFTNLPNLIDLSIQLNIDSQIILFRESSKFLSVVIDRKLSFEMHANLCNPVNFENYGYFFTN